MAKNNEKKTQVVLNKKVSSKSFVKVYMTDFLVALNIISSKSVDVLAVNSGRTATLARRFSHGVTGF